MNLSKFIESKRKCSADYHLYMAKKWRKYGEPNLLHTPMIYSAFEFRMAIERFVFEIFYLIKEEQLLDSTEFTEENIKKIDRFSNLLKVLYENVGNKKILFKAFYYNKTHVQIFTEGHIKLSIPDLGKLHKYWEELSEFCHRQLVPGKTWENYEWIKKAYLKLNRVEQYFHFLLVENNFGWLRKSSLPPELLELRNEFLNDEIDMDQLCKRMEIVKPLLEHKKHIREQLDLIK
ncbi:MAG: hypothetical protein U5R06_10675 [candidate division KSB1 bacterium]|nr:hypothetical protein [candidate division KSB1 bacterium]